MRLHLTKVRRKVNTAVNVLEFVLKNPCCHIPMGLFEVVFDITIK